MDLLCIVFDPCRHLHSPQLSDLLHMHESLIRTLSPRLGVLPDALRTRCARCTKVQKSKALDVITRLYYQHPAIYTALAERYDPKGIFTRNYESWFDEQNAVNPRPHEQSKRNDGNKRIPQLLER